MLSIDFAPAMLGTYKYRWMTGVTRGLMIGHTGWDKSGHPKPILEGVIVCAEHEAVLREAWAQDTERREKAREKKRVETVLKRWAKLTRALLIKHRLKGESESSVPVQGLKNKTPKKQGNLALALAVLVGLTATNCSGQRARASIPRRQVPLRGGGGQVAQGVRVRTRSGVREVVSKQLITCT
jgi:hypothetical protein